MIKQADLSLCSFITGVLERSEIPMIEVVLTETDGTVSISVLCELSTGRRELGEVSYVQSATAYLPGKISDLSSSVLKDLENKLSA